MKKSASSKLAEYKALFECFEKTDRRASTSLHKPKTWYKYDVVIYIDYHAIEKYDFFVEKIYSNFSDYYSEETFISNIDEFIVNLIQNNTAINLTSINEFEHKLTSVKFNDSVMMPIHGISIENQEPLEFGPFKIFDTRQQNTHHGELFESSDDGIYISIPNIQYSDVTTAFHKALIKFNEFKYLLHYIVGYRSDRHAVNFGIRDQTEHNERIIITESCDKFIIRNNTVVYSSKENKFIYPINLSDPIFVNDLTENPRIWATYNNYYNGTSTELSTRIIRSILAAGKSASLLDTSDSFINLIIAYEILLTNDDRSLFSRSLGQNFSDSFALILGDNLAEREKISADIKKFYRIRSALVHSNGKQPSASEYKQALRYLRHFIHILLTNNKFKNFNTIKDLQEHINRLRLS